MFAKTQEALSSLQQRLQCGKCNYQIEELMCLGDCHHWFCRSCVKSNSGCPCPICGIPSVARKNHVDVQLSNVASLCSQMMKLINDCNSSTLSEDNLESTNLPENLFKLEDSSNGKSAEERRGYQRDVVGKDEEKIAENQTGISCGVSLSTPDQFINGRKRSKKARGTNLENKGTALNCNDLVHETPESSGFVKLKDNNAKSSKNAEPSTVSNVFDTMSELITPVSNKRKSQSLTTTPTHSGRKIKKTEETSSDQQNYNAPTIKRSQAKKNPKANQSNSSVDSAMIRKVTPQSTRKKQANLCKRNAKGETPLQVATIRMNINEVRRLLQDGANPNVKDNAGWTPLHEAVGRGTADIAALLIDSGASVNAPGMDNLTPLHEAVVYQYTSCVQLLIDNGADMFCRNVYGYSSLDLAQKDEIKNLLLEASQTRSISDVDLPMLDESFKPLCFTGSSLSNEKMKLLTKYSRTLHAKVVQQVAPDVTHLITSVREDSSCPRTFKYLNAIVAGKWVVDIQWLENCHKQKCRVSEQIFQITGSAIHPKSDAPKRALENRLKQLPPLLDGCQVFFYGKFDSSSFSKEELAKLVKQGGGVVLTREPHLHTLDDYPYTHPYHAQHSDSLADCTIFVIYQDACINPPSVQASRMSCLPVSWLIDSIDTFSLLDKKMYIK